MIRERKIESREEERGKGREEEKKGERRCYFLSPS